MKYFLLISLVTLQSLTIACSSPQQAQSRVQRQPLMKQPHEYKSPTNYDLRDRGYNPKTGKVITYDHKPQIELIDAKSGKYAFKWIGYDGKEKTIIYQRADAVDVIVSATVLQTPEGKYLYNYKVETLPSSGTYLSHFTVQNFALDTKPIEVGGKIPNNRDLCLLEAFRNIPYNDESFNIEDFSIGQMSNLIQQFKEGGWIAFGVLNTENSQIKAGGTLEIKMLSSAPPDLVGCRVAGGELTLKGVGEHMPFILENMMRSYGEFPYGYTVGPVESVRYLSPSERAKRMMDKLPQFKKLGWITDEALQRYERQLKAENFDALIARAEDDLKNEQITTEVFSIIKAIKQ